MEINKKHIALFNELKLLAQNGQGGILLISGESGVGKSYLIKQMIQHCSSGENRILNVYVQNDVPIGNINTHNLQPLKPFAKALEVILESKIITAKKQLAMNMSLTALTALPFVGDVFYAAKELSKDWRQYKKEKTNEAVEVEENRADELLNAFSIKATKHPIVIFMDNMQYIDSSSVEFMLKLKKKIENLNILLVLAFRDSEVISPEIPFYHFLSEAEDLDKIEIKNFNNEEVCKLSEIYIQNYKQNDEFDNWIYDKTLGNAGELFEFYDYFKNLEVFDRNGDLILNLESEFIPTSSRVALASSLNELTIEEKDLLASAAQEGNEFSAVLLSEILNRDILIIIRLLKSIQHKSKIIKSVGSYKRYGIMTTIYQFNQIFYFNYFRDYLEYEEKRHIQSLISNFLRKQLVNIDNPEEKKEILASIISFSQALGDSEQVDKTMNEFREIAVQTGDNELLSIIGGKNVEQSESNSDVASSGGIDGGGVGAMMSFSDLRKYIVRDYFKGDYVKSIQISNDFIKNESEYLTKKELTLLLLMTSKLEVNEGDYVNAKNHLNQAEKLISDIEDNTLECIILNINAALHNKQGHFSRAAKYLRKAADLAISLPLELRLLTLSNIAILLEKESPAEALIYKNSAEKLKSELEFNNWWN
jgi:hypothetical protein